MTMPSQNIVISNSNDNAAPCTKLSDHQILVKNINLEYLDDMKMSCHVCGVYAANMFKFYVF